MHIVKDIFQSILSIRYIFKQNVNKDVRKSMQESWNNKTQEHVDELLNENCRKQHYFIENWMKENKNYHRDWCWTKDKVFMDGLDITEDLFKLMLLKNLVI